MIQERVLEELKGIVGAGHVKSGAGDREVYSYDGSLALGAPDVVVFPANAEETAAVVKTAAKANVACTPRGFGTNLSGGSVTPKGGIVLGFTRMNRILSIRPEARTATVEPGVTNLELQNALAPMGFYYAPDPASQKVSTLGGNVGENSGGPHCLKYGVTTNHVLGVEAVLSDGDRVYLGGPSLDAPGYDIRGLFVGSEGTFGAVTELTLRILPKPEAVITMLAIYDSAADAARSVSDIIAAGIMPATLEMMDKVVMCAVEDSFPCGYPRDAAAVLIIEVEGVPAGLQEQADRIIEICKADGCRDIRKAKDDDERNKLWAGRRGAFGAVARLAPNYLVADGTVPRTKLPEALERVAEIGKRYGLMCGNVLHAGDGNLHPLFLFDARDTAVLEKVHEAGNEILKVCVDLGGTITGEHGVGLEKLDALSLVFTEDDLAYQDAVLQVFNPEEIFNPGKAIPQSPDMKGPADASLEINEQVLSPADADEATEMVAAALLERKPLQPLGGGRRAEYGNALKENPIPLRSEKMTGLIEYDPPNQVAVFRSGTRYEEAQRLLAENNQWLPYRPPLAEGSTLGGMVALAACGPERLAYGAPRDGLLGLKFVSGFGKPINAGGCVVKNVAGFDITRLLTGSAGTLGFLTELTFRLSAVPETCRVVSAIGDTKQCAAAGRELLKGKLQPVFVTAVPVGNGHSTEGQAKWRLQVGFEGFERTVGPQSKACAEVLAEALLKDESQQSYALLEPPQNIMGSIFECRFVLRADIPLDSVAKFVADAASAFNGATQYLDLGCGRVYAGLDLLSDEGWTNLCTVAEGMRGHVLLEKAPGEFKDRHDVFGTERADWKVVHALKAKLDPCGIFSPGRLPGRK